MLNTNWFNIVMLVLILLALIGGYLLYLHISWSRYKRKRWAELEASWKLQDTISKAYFKNFGKTE